MELRFIDKQREKFQRPTWKFYSKTDSRSIVEGVLDGTNKNYYRFEDAQKVKGSKSDSYIGTAKSHQNQISKTVRPNLRNARLFGFMTKPNTLNQSPLRSSSEVRLQISCIANDLSDLTYTERKRR